PTATYSLSLHDALPIFETTVGRVLFNQVVPEELGFINELLTKKSLRDIIGEVVKITGMARAAQFLDDIKDLGFQSAFNGGLSFKDRKSTPLNSSHVKIS